MAPSAAAPLKIVRRETWHVQVGACAGRPDAVMAFLPARGFAHYTVPRAVLARGRTACTGQFAALHIGCNLNGVPDASRAERRSANPSNLIVHRVEISYNKRNGFHPLNCQTSPRLTVLVPTSFTRAIALRAIFS